MGWLSRLIEKFTGNRNVEIGGDSSGDIVTGDHSSIKNIFLDKTPRTKAQALRNAYLDRLMSRLGYLTLEGIDPKAASAEPEARLRLRSVYTALLTRESERKGEDGREFSEAARPDRDDRRPALALLNDHDRLVLLGDPGSGKTTFARFAALCMAGELLGKPDANLALLTHPLPDDDGDDTKEPQPWNHGPLLPVFVILRDLAAVKIQEEKPGAGLIWRFIEADLAESKLSEFFPILEKTLRETGGLVLLDGLDEVPEAESRREKIKAAVTDFIHTCGNCRVVLTSRTYAYHRQDWRIDGLHETILAPFSEGQIRRFVDRWYAHIAELRGMMSQADAQARADLLKRAVFGAKRLRELAERPLLLTLMASLHAWRGGTLPEKRQELYEDTVDLLLDWWETAKRKAPGTDEWEPSLTEWLRIDRDQVRALLNELAFKAHESQPEARGTADVPEGELVCGLLDLSPKKDIRPGLLTDYLSNRAGLLLPRGVKVFTFPHRTFQEYLAACHLTDLDFPIEVAKLARANPERWREVTLLAGAKAAAGAGSTIWQLAEALCWREPENSAAEKRDAWGAQLAGQALAESADLRRVAEHNRAKLDRIRRWLVRILEGTDFPAMERAVAGRSLGVIGDPRKAVTTLDRMEFCYVPPGPFMMGEKGDDEAELHQCDALVEEYWIGRYPVTNAQFSAFVDAGGYEDEGLWGEAKAAGFWSADGFKGRGDGSARKSPADFGSPFHLPNHPVVGVTWYEALAFTRWLDRQWRNSGRLPEGFRLRLCTEAEWEKASRGGLEIPAASTIVSADESTWGVSQTLEMKPNPRVERRFPWGETENTDKPNPEAANYDDTGINTTSAVGAFSLGETPFGCRDMSGNVWEWTVSLWGKNVLKPDFTYPYRHDEKWNNETAGNEILRVVRGGAFFSFVDLVRCAYRFRDYPHSRDGDFGFRFCVAPNPTL
ncbi:MAG: NACHT domain-containing protein [Desulfococcaceae bacterium]